MCSQFTVMLRSVKRNPVCHSANSLSSALSKTKSQKSNCHSARSETESQNLLQNHRIVILREANGSRNCQTAESIGEPMMDSATPDENVLRAESMEQFCQIHQRFSYELSLLTLSFCAKQSEVAEPSNCHSARSETNRRVAESNCPLSKHHDGFFHKNPCRMTMDGDNELKDLRFCLIHQLPKIFKFSL